MAVSAFTADAVEQIMASQYLSAAGLVILLWDHLLTFADEAELIWKAKFSMPKLLFLFNRYTVPFVVIFQAHEFSGLAQGQLQLTVRPQCKVGYAVTVSLGMISIATSNFLVLLRLWCLWDHDRRLMKGTLLLYVITQLVSIPMAIYVIYDMLPILGYIPELHVCAPLVKPKFALLWAPGITFEFMVFITTLWNAMDKPRTLDERAAKVMYRDGSVYFFGLFILRIANLLLTLLAPLSLSFLCVYFIWSVSSITLAHLILNLRRLARESEDDSIYVKLPSLGHFAAQSIELQIHQFTQY